MSKVDHTRRYDTLQKAYINIATAVVIGLIGWQASISLDNKDESIKLNVTMKHMIDKVGAVEINQQDLINEVTGIKISVARTCDRLNMLLEGTKIPCK